MGYVVEVFEVRFATMIRFYQLLFFVSLTLISWLAMMGIHELGHVIAAAFTGGSVMRVVLHPLMISRTDLSENPYPAIVVWAGPLLGVFIPFVLWLIVHRLRWSQTQLVQFFAGFCLIANGAYIAGGSWEGIGDCGVMLHSGTPLWVMWVFGLLTIPTGFFLWHQLGSIQELIQKPERISARSAWSIFVVLISFIVLMELFSSR